MFTSFFLLLIQKCQEVTQRLILEDLKGVYYHNSATKMKDEYKRLDYMVMLLIVVIGIALLTLTNFKLSYAEEEEEPGYYMEEKIQFLYNIVKQFDHNNPWNDTKPYDSEKNFTCLPRAIELKKILDQYGFYSEVRLGYRGNKDGHSWLYVQIDKNINIEIFGQREDYPLFLGEEDIIFYSRYIEGKND